MNGFFFPLVRPPTAGKPLLRRIGEGGFAVVFSKVDRNYVLLAIAVDGF